MGGGWREPQGGGRLSARPNLRREGRGKRTHCLARAAELLNPQRTAAGNLGREVISISELATSAVLRTPSHPGKGRVRRYRERKELQRNRGRGVKSALFGPLAPR